jgi:hypothetical protein
VFFDADHGRLCAIHRDAGPALMPSACRNFPRIALRDPRGIFVTLSHFCPSAARLLLDTDDIAIVDAPPSLSLAGEVEGLDATAVMPPLLRPDMLTDFEGYSAWEREGIGVLNTRMYSAREALDVIRSATAAVSRWRPGTEALAIAVRRAFDRARSEWTARDTEHSPVEHAIKAFLAAHLFANWSAYQDGGVAGVVRFLERTLELLHRTLRAPGGPPAVGGRGSTMSGGQGPESFVAAVRAVDLRLRHSVAAPGGIGQR